MVGAMLNVAASPCGWRGVGRRRSRGGRCGV